jgi:TorA maturation chaperone TorD
MHEQEHDLLAACERVCRTLARCFEVPAADLVTDRELEDLVVDATRLDAQLGELAEALVQSLADDDLRELTGDFHRLFVGTPRMLAPPCGSAWLDGANCVIGVSTLGVIGLYRDGDFDLDDAFVEPPDHIAAELQFLHRLIVRQHAAKRVGDGYALSEAGALERRLLDAHLARWIEPFCDAIGAAARTRFYRTLARIAARFVALETAICETPSLAAAR